MNHTHGPPPSIRVTPYRTNPSPRLSQPGKFGIDFLQLNSDIKSAREETSVFLLLEEIHHQQYQLPHIKRVRDLTGRRGVISFRFPGGGHMSARRTGHDLKKSLARAILSVCADEG